jgi:hypothetical protein
MNKGSEYRRKVRGWELETFCVRSVRDLLLWELPLNAAPSSLKKSSKSPKSAQEVIVEEESISMSVDSHSARKGLADGRDQTLTKEETGQETKSSSE